MKIKKKVLIIDDDEDFRASTKTILENEGFHVFEACTGKEGLSKLTEVNPDVIILDIMMETTNEGYLLNEIIKFQKEYEKYRKIPILMVSSIKEDPFSRFPFANGEVEMITPDYYLTKPLDYNKFMNVLHKALNKNNKVSKN